MGLENTQFDMVFQTVSKSVAPEKHWPWWLCIITWLVIIGSRFREHSALSKATLFMLCASIMPPDPLANFTLCDSLLQIFGPDILWITCCDHEYGILPGVLGCRPLRPTVLVRLGTNTLRLPGGTPIFVVSRQQFMKYPG